MTLKLKPPSPRSAAPSTPFSFATPDDEGSPEQTVVGAQPTVWLPGGMMKIFGSEPLNSVSDVGLVKCKECGKPVLGSCLAEHAETCASLNKAGKGGADEGKGTSKKRKGSPTPEDGQPAKKKTKPIAKVTKGRVKGPVDYDRQCGVINDKGLPCSRSLTCKSHSMGAKRAVQGRSRPYDELLLDWQRANNPNFVEPVKRETKAEKKEKKEKEKAEKKRLAEEAAAGMEKKKKTKKTPAVVVRVAEEMEEEMIDSEAEMDDVVHIVRRLHPVPLAVPVDAGTWFVQRRERARCCRDLLMASLLNNRRL